MPVDFSVVWITPAISPSCINLTFAPTDLKDSIKLSCLGLSRTQTVICSIGLLSALLSSVTFFQDPLQVK